MSINERKLPVLALSACSIPVMLAFAGQGARSTGELLPSVSGESAFFNSGPRQHSQPAIDSVGDKRANCADDEGGVLSDSVPFDNSLVPWMCVSPDGGHFWVAKGAAISAYRFAQATDAQESYSQVASITAVDINDAHAAMSHKESVGSVSLQMSDDGQWLYQLFEATGAMAVYEVSGGALVQVEWLTA